MIVWLGSTLIGVARFGILCLVLGGFIGFILRRRFVLIVLCLRGHVGRGNIDENRG